jgi:hypothetical protein
MYSVANPFGYNQNTSNDRLESLLGWESEERARNFVESGYSDYGRKASRSDFPAIGAGLSVRVVAATWGRNFAVYENSARHEFADYTGNPRLFRKVPSGTEPSGQRFLNGQQFIELYSAVSYANRLGLVMNVHISITWKMLGFECQHEAVKALRYEFFKHLQEWCEYRMPNGHRFVWLYVHEVGRRHGFHTHILTAVPDELRDDLRTWMAARMARLSRTGNVPKGAFKIVAPPSDKIGRQWRYLQYLCKGLGTAEEVVAAVGEEPSVKAASLIWGTAGRPADIQCRKRCGVSNNLGRQARQRSHYESLLERGITDVRQLYAGMEYLAYLKSHPEIASGHIYDQLLAAEIRVKEIQAEDVALAVVNCVARNERKREAARQRRVARQLEAEHQERLVRLNKLII